MQLGPDASLRSLSCRALRAWHHLRDLICTACVCNLVTVHPCNPHAPQRRFHRGLVLGAEDIGGSQRPPACTPLRAISPLGFRMPTPARALALRRGCAPAINRGRVSDRIGVTPNGSRLAGARRLCCHAMSSSSADRPRNLDPTTTKGKGCWAPLPSPLENDCLTSRGVPYTPKRRPVARRIRVLAWTDFPANRLWAWASFQARSDV